MKRSYFIWIFVLILTGFSLSGCESLKDNKSAQLNDNEKVQLAFDKRD